MHSLRLTIIIFFILFIAAPLQLLAQTDSVSRLVLSEAEFLAIVRKFHPYLEQSRLEQQKADAALRESRGEFDPVLKTGYDRKTFDSKLYYSYFNPEIKIPTWYGIEVYGGLEEILGTRTDIERTIGQTSYLGVSVPLGKDLVLDKRRAVLQQAKIMQQQTREEQRLAVNDLLYEAIGAYWSWVKEYQVYTVISKLLQLNEERYRLICIEAQQGARAAMDTLEAMAQVQQFRIQESEAALKFQNAGLELSNYLWLQEKQAFPWNNRIIPDTTWLAKSDWAPGLPALDELITTATIEHPKLKAYQYKTDWMRVERKLKFQSLLPKLDLKYNLLNKGYNVLNKVDGAFLENNYKFGIDFQMPLLIRQGRGSFQQAGFKLRQLNLEIDQSRLEVENKIKAYYNEVLTITNQIRQSEKAYSLYQQLFDGEFLRFRMGESTVFLINARENKAFEAFQKLLELKTKWYKSQAALSWSTGSLKVVN